MDSLGQILDLRNKENCPCLKVVSKWPSQRVKELCVRAYEEQMRELEEAEGAEGRLMRTLKSELRTVSIVCCYYRSMEQICATVHVVFSPSFFLIDHVKNTSV